MHVQVMETLFCWSINSRVFLKMQEDFKCEITISSQRQIQNEFEESEAVFNSRIRIILKEFESK